MNQIYQAIDVARSFEGATCQELVSDFYWQFKTVQTIYLFRFLPERDWSTWLDEELRMERDDDRFYWRSILEGWDNDKLEPIILTPTNIWDGWHRSAIAIRLGISHLPAVIGYPL